MRRPTDVALYIAAGIAAAYVLNQWVLHWWADDKTDADDDDPPASMPKLPPLRTHSLPPPLPSARPLLSESTIPDAMKDEAASDTDTESFVDILSPSPTHVHPGRSSLRAHDLFAESHISFAELGSLVAPQNEP